VNSVRGVDFSPLYLPGFLGTGLGLGLVLASVVGYVVFVLLGRLVRCLRMIREICDKLLTLSLRIVLVVFVDS
jgi:hypothetical protein